MSELKVNSIVDASGGSTAKVNGFTPTISNMSGRNRIINGEMRIDQRNAGASVTATSTAAYNVDRWQAGMVGANGTMQRVSSGRTDFPFALRLTGTSSTTVAWCSQKIESFNVADLVGQSVTISFLAAASALTNVAVNLSYANSTDSFGSITSISSQSKTINSTLTQYTVTVSNLPAGAANGLYLEFVPSGNLGTGTFTITGVQLEAGSVATPFERRPFGTELALCQRYFFATREGAVGQSNSSFGSGTFVFAQVSFPCEMRVAPAVVASAPLRIDVPGVIAITQSSASVTGNISNNAAFIEAANFTGVPTGQILRFTGGGFIQFSAEL